MNAAMDDYPDENPLRIWTSGIVRVIVCIILLAVIAGAVYATCLPAFAYQKEKAAQAAAGDQP
jgi:hypothetical protein